MNWDAIGAIGEMVGAAAVVLTLLVLVMQVRDGTRATEESNRLEKALAMDRHSDSMSRWRGRLMENAELARIWLVGSRDGELQDIEALRLDNLWIDFANSQRSNFVRAQTVGEAGLAQQAVLSIAVEIRQSKTFQNQWDLSRAWHGLTSPEFVAQVEERVLQLEKEGTTIYRAGTRSREPA
jgi:hypothetical protein